MAAASDHRSLVIWRIACLYVTRVSVTACPLSACGEWGASVVHFFTFSMSPCVVGFTTTRCRLSATTRSVLPVVEEFAMAYAMAITNCKSCSRGVALY